VPVLLTVLLPNTNFSFFVVVLAVVVVLVVVVVVVVVSLVVVSLVVLLVVVVVVLVVVLVLVEVLVVLVLVVVLVLAVLVLVLAVLVLMVAVVVVVVVCVGAAPREEGRTSASLLYTGGGFNSTSHPGGGVTTPPGGSRAYRCIPGVGRGGPGTRWISGSTRTPSSPGGGDRRTTKASTCSFFTCLYLMAYATYFSHSRGLKMYESGGHDLFKQIMTVILSSSSNDDKKLTFRSCGHRKDNLACPRRSSLWVRNRLHMRTYT
jgi:hypothetical protein